MKVKLTRKELMEMLSETLRKGYEVVDIYSEEVNTYQLEIKKIDQAFEDVTNLDTTDLKEKK